MSLLSIQCLGLAPGTNTSLTPRHDIYIKILFFFAITLLLICSRIICLFLLLIYTLIKDNHFLLLSKLTDFTSQYSNNKHIIQCVSISILSILYILTRFSLTSFHILSKIILPLEWLFISQKCYIMKNQS